MCLRSHDVSGDTPETIQSVARLNQDLVALYNVAIVLIVDLNEL